MYKVLVFTLFCFYGGQISAKEKVQVNSGPLWLYQVNADLRKVPAAGTISNGYYFELLDEQVNLLQNTKYIHYIKHIASQSGVQSAAEVSVTFSPEFQELVYHQITIIRNGVLVSQLRPSQIKIVQEETEAADYQYNGLKRAFVTLKDVQKGDRIEVAYSVIGFNPVFGKKYFDDYYFTNQTAVCNYFRTLITGADRKLFIKNFNNAPAPLERVEGNKLIYLWNNPSLKLVESQAGTPSWYNNYPYISVTEFSSWEEVANWGLSLFKNYSYPLPAPLKAQISDWHRLSNGDKDLFAIMATRFVQEEVRYLGLEIGSHTHEPHTPAEVFRHRYGDCKDKALLLTVLLREEGIPAYTALVNTGARQKLVESAPSSGEFDHAIVAIERSANNYIFVDPTISGQRGELVNLYIPAYGYALVLREHQNRLDPIEPGSLHNTTIVESIDVKYMDSSRFTVKSTYAGGAADEVRNTFSSLSTKELEDNYRQFYSTVFDGIKHAAPIEQSDDSLKNEFTVKETYSIPNVWHKDEKGKEAFDFFSKALNEYLPDPSSASMDAPLALGFPRTVTYIAQINMPETWSFNISELHIKNGAYQFDFTPITNNSRISLHYYLKTFKDHIEPQELSQYKSDYKKISAKLGFQLYKDNGLMNKPSSEASPAPGRIVNWPAVWFTFFFTMFFTWLVRHLNARSEEVTYTNESGYHLGGWTIVLGISIGWTLLIQLAGLIKNNYFSYSVWVTLGELGGQKLQYLLFAELGITLLWIGSAIALLYWFTGRRDIFPKMFIWYAAALLTGQLILITLYNTVHYPGSFGDLKGDAITGFGRTCVYSLIWVSYILRSERVKGTFLQPFKGKGE